MESSTGTVAPELWDLVHILKVPIRKAAARYGLPVSAAYEVLAQEKRRREGRDLKLPTQSPPPSKTR
jgi:hypothetical protein